ncbi:hypothetical protein TWF730_010415 [Orbilia blumenaviensis]|uniref:Uncharacterized protein n=1 Tax=Orbilia blumenaviensis TaxID=1796055 RepID=A0AAV9US20_9PEZI
MTFREKIKSILHHSHGHKKSVSNAPTAPASSPTPAAATTAAKPDPNKPPNARDPGFRKSFNLGDPPTTNDSAKTEPRKISAPNAQNLAVNGNAGSHMYTLEKYGDDYLAVSPRTNVTVPEGNAANRGLASCSTLDADESAKAGLRAMQEQKPKDPVAGSAKALDGLSSPQQNPDSGREQFAHGERKDSGFVEPVPTRDATVSPNSKPESPASFDLEASPPANIPPALQAASAVNTTPIAPKHATRIGSPETKYTSLLVPPHTVEDGTSSVYSDDSTRPTLQQIASSDYGPLVESPEPKTAFPVSTTATATATEHQRRYSILVSEELPTVDEADTRTNGAAVEEKESFPVIDENADLLTVVRRSFGESSAAGDISPSILPADETNAWSQDLIANIDKIQSGEGEQERERNIINGAMSNPQDGIMVPDTAPLENPIALVGNQAAAFTAIAPTQALQPTKKVATRTTAITTTTDISVDQQAAAFANIVMAHVDSVRCGDRGLGNRNGYPISTLLPPSEKPIVTTTNTVPHAAACQMGDNVLDGQTIKGRPPIMTTTNMVPHADAYHIGDSIPSVPVFENKSPIATTNNIVPRTNATQIEVNDGGSDFPKFSFNESIYANRDKVQFDSALMGGKEKVLGDEDSVYAVTKEMPGAF